MPNSKILRKAKPLQNAAPTEIYRSPFQILSPGRKGVSERTVIRVQIFEDVA